MVRLHYQVVLNEDLFMYGHGCLGDWRAQIAANKRLRALEAALGPDAVRAAIDQVQDETRARLGSEHWRVFTEGTEEERDANRRRMHADDARLCGKLDDGAARTAAEAHLRAHPTDVYFDADGDLWHLTECFHADRPSALRLKVRSRTMGLTEMAGFEMPVPPGWDHPYGLC